MLNIHQKFCKETFHDGRLVDFKPVYDENFNFAYDVIDEIAKAEPDRRAMVWCDSHGEEREFTFGDISRYSSKAANLFKSVGIKKGDTVVLVLKRHYQFWFAVLGLHKIGAVGIPATNLLTKRIMFIASMPPMLQRLWRQLSERCRSILMRLCRSPRR